MYYIKRAEYRGRDGELIKVREDTLPDTYQDHHAANQDIMHYADNQPGRTRTAHHAGFSVAFLAVERWSDGKVLTPYVEFWRIWRDSK